MKKKKSLILQAQIEEGGGKGGGGLRESLDTDTKGQHANTLRMTTMMCSCFSFLFLFSISVLDIHSSGFSCPLAGKKTMS